MPPMAASSICRRDSQRGEEAVHPCRPGRARRPRGAGSNRREARRARSCKALLGKGGVPDESPYATGGVGLLGTRASQEALQGCDTLLIVGSTFPYIEFYPEPGKARAVQIDLDPQAHRPPLSGRSGPRRRQSRARSARSFRWSARTRTAASSKRRRKAMRDWREVMPERGTRTRHADEAAGRRARAQQAARRRCHRHHRLAAPTPPGPRATSMRGEHDVLAARARSRRWPTVSPTRSRRR